MKTIKELATEAIQIQDARNLTGLVHGWSRAVTDLRYHCPGAGTDNINTHPINVLWASKCRDLAFGKEDFCHLSQEQWTNAYAACRRLAEIP